MGQKAIKDITPEEFADYLEDETARCKLTAKGLSGLKTILTGIIKRAKRKNLIDYLPSRVYEEAESSTVKRHRENDEQIFTGVRVGEMVALSYDDFDSDTVAYIHKTESRFMQNGKYQFKLKDAPKTDAGFRKVYLPEDYAWITKKMRSLRPFSTYLCTNEKGKRMTTECLRKRLYRICDKLEFDHRKSTHKTRKTYCSIILDEGFDANLVKSLMGHTDIATSEGSYHFDRKSKEKKQNMVNNIKEFKLAN